MAAHACGCFGDQRESEKLLARQVVSAQFPIAANEMGLICEMIVGVEPVKMTGGNSPRAYQARLRLKSLVSAREVSKGGA